MKLMKLFYSISLTSSSSTPFAAAGFSGSSCENTQKLIRNNEVFKNLKYKS
jgi:hypothetical protein